MVSYLMPMDNYKTNSSKEAYSLNSIPHATPDNFVKYRNSQRLTILCLLIVAAFSFLLINVLFNGFTTNTFFVLVDSFFNIGNIITISPFVIMCTVIIYYAVHLVTKTSQPRDRRWKEIVDIGMKIVKVVVITVLTLCVIGATLLIIMLLILTHTRPVGDL